MRVRCNSNDKISMERGGIFEVTFGWESQRSLHRLLKIASVFNHLGAKRTIAAFLSVELPNGTKTVTATPARAPAKASDWP